jgi:branched-chain amino acid transport system ATP-binding protein
VESNDVLEVRGITVSYGRLVALHDVSYVVSPGQMVCLLGGNASGKSTSMKAIFGQVGLAAGDVWWRGERITDWPTSKRVRSGLAAVPEGRRVFGRLTVEENLLIGARNRSDVDDVKRDLREMREMFPVLNLRRSQAAGTLSGGEQQMLAIARALMSRPKLICMDEPSMGLSPKLVKETFALIGRIRDQGTAVFVIEQNANAALALADYGYVLQTGTVVLEGSGAAIASDPMMRAAYLGAHIRAGQHDQDPVARESQLPS